MAEPGRVPGDDARLERLLRAALGAPGVAPRREAASGDTARAAAGDTAPATDEARSTVVTRVRRRRVRRLQGLGASAVVALGLAAVLPQVLGAASGPVSVTTGPGTPSGAAQHRRPAASVPSGTASGARCAGPGTVMDCGALLAGPAGTASSSHAAEAPASITATGAQVPAVTLRVGEATTVTLLPPPKGRRWAAPTVVAVSAGVAGAQVVEVAPEHPAGVVARAERFRLVARAQGTVVVEVKEAPPGNGRGAAVAAGPAQAGGTTEVWLVRVEVERA